MWRQLGRWPLILAAAICIGAAVVLLDQAEQRLLAAGTLLTLGAVLFGAALALYARDTGDHHHDDPR